MTKLAYLAGRGVIAVAGADRVGFLNGLVSNDVAKVAAGQAVWAAMLTPQGRYFSDFFMFHDEERLLLDAPRTAVPEILKKLNRYKLRAAVTLTDVSEMFHAYAAWEGAPPPVPITAPDPRLREAGFRLLSEVALVPNAAPDEYDAHRHWLGLPDGPPDLEADKTLLLEAGFDELNGVDWQKGCYMGQELTARTKYRGLVKRRLVPVQCSDTIKTGALVMADGAEVGDVRSFSGRMGLAMLRVDALQKSLSADRAVVTPKLPGWLVIPA
ncbi:MAG: folate-binding protein YgfZ [Acidocella sp. 20-57-95]|nr:MAG: folate-binding protein YgfZ [Acidocella sp. 20-57-95]OYV58771.1 MAG: folate-binding protein YgfZ [Acidocella sp. 21-58-7]HQT65030.1 folate-binding protein [Acidocella sp.]HQU03925.1 folate-binding protein [Acidocella sp.]